MTASGMAQVYSRPVALLALLTSVLLLVAACGGDEEPEAEKPREIETAGGFSTYEVASAGFSIAVPSTWNAVTADEAFGNGSMDDFLEENPDFEPYREAFEDPNSAFKFVALDPDVREGFATNVNVVVQEVPGEIGFDEYAQAGLAEVRGIAAVKGAIDEVVSVPAGKAQRLSYLLDFSIRGETLTVSTLQYALRLDGKSYVITYSALPSREDEYAETFERSARSFSLG